MALLGSGDGGCCALGPGYWPLPDVAPPVRGQHQSEHLGHVPGRSPAPDEVTHCAADTSPAASLWEVEERRLRASGDGPGPPGSLRTPAWPHPASTRTAPVDRRAPCVPRVLWTVQAGCPRPEVCIENCPGRFGERGATRGSSPGGRRGLGLGAPGVGLNGAKGRRGSLNSTEGGANMPPTTRGTRSPGSHGTSVPGDPWGWSWVPRSCGGGTSVPHSRERVEGLGEARRAGTPVYLPPVPSRPKGGRRGTFPIVKVESTPPFQSGRPWGDSKGSVCSRGWVAPSPPVQSPRARLRPPGSCRRTLWRGRSPGHPSARAGDRPRV